MGVCSVSSGGIGGELSSAGDEDGGSSSPPPIEPLPTLPSKSSTKLLKALTAIAACVTAVENTPNAGGVSAAATTSQQQQQQYHVGLPPALDLLFPALTLSEDGELIKGGSGFWESGEAMEECEDMEESMEGDGGHGDYSSDEDMEGVGRRSAWHVWPRPAAARACSSTRSAPRR